MKTLSPALSKDIRVRDLLLNALTFFSGAIAAIGFRNRGATKSVTAPVLAGLNRVH